MTSNMLTHRLARRIALACLIVVIFLAAATVRAAPAPSVPISPDFAAIDAYVESQMRDLRVPGLALGIVQGDQIVHLQGFGVADPSGRAVTPQTPFVIGSTTKSFTALAVLQLVEQGKIELDAPVQRYLPWFRIADEDASKRITVRHLLTLSSGLSAAGDGPLILSTDTSDRALEKGVRGLAALPLSAPIGSTWEYVNANYAILGLLVQTISGQPYEAYVQDHIFVPLEMRQSFTSKDEALRHGLATGYRSWFGFPAPFAAAPHPRAALPAGYLIASAEDLAHYLIAQVNDGHYGAATVLSPAGIATLHQPAIYTGSFAYGMGWKIGTRDGVTIVKHEGDTASFHAELALVPEQRWGVVILTNMQSQFGQDGLKRIEQGVTALLLGRKPSTTPDIFWWLVYGSVLGACTLLVIGMVRSIITLRRWRSQPERHPHGLARRAVAVGLPLVLHIALAWGMLVGFPKFFGLPLEGLLLMAPDLGYVSVVSGALALAWGIVRTVLVLWVLRRPGMPHRAGAPVNA